MAELNLPEIKLVRLLIIALTEKKNKLLKQHRVGQTFIVFCSKATKLQQKCNLFKLFDTSVKEKRKLMNFSFVFKLYFSSASNYVQLNYKFFSGI